MEGGCTLFVVRFLQALCLLGAAVLVALASGYCVTQSEQGQTSTRCDVNGTPFGIEHWSDGSTYKEVQRQYVVFIACLFFFVITFTLVCLSCVDCGAHRYIVMLVCGVAAMAMLVVGVLEAWFAAGFGKTQDVGPFHVRSWVAAAVLCFVSMILYVFDVCIAVKG